MFQIWIVSMAVALIIGAGVPTSVSTKPKSSPYSAWQIDFNGNYSSLYASQFAPESDPKAYCLGGDSTISGQDGDLLSSMIVDTSLQEWMRSQHFDSSLLDTAALKRIELAMARATQAKLNKNFYAYQVCWSEKAQTAVASGVADYEDKSQFKNGIAYKADGYPDWPNEVLIVMQGDTVSVLSKSEINDLRLFGNTVTGAETGACAATLKKQTLEWSCFVSTSLTDPTLPEDTDRTRDWIIPLQDKLVDPQMITSKLVNVSFPRGF